MFWLTPLLQIYAGQVHLGPPHNSNCAASQLNSAVSGFLVKSQPDTASGDATNDVSLRRSIYLVVAEPRQRTATAMARLAPLFGLLNWVALVGWTYVAIELVRIAVVIFSNGLTDPTVQAALEALHTPVIVGLEGICVVEVLRIVVGDLPGNLVLGVVLHTIRCTALSLAWSADHWTGPVIFASWAVTEVSRYPMYVFPQQETVRSFRMVVPLVTFPIGAFSEAYATYLQWNDGLPLWKQGLFAAVLFVNGVLGPTMAYPALLRKGLPVLGLAKKKPKKKTS